MRLLIQLVNHASVTVDDRVTGSIDKGYLAFVGVSDSDTVDIADKMLKKLVNLRIFKDENDKTNLSINDVGGSLLLVSQFTLYADARKGNRPSFTGAGAPDHANALYEHMISEARNTYSLNTQTGEFGADMKVSLENDGPFTIMLDSDEILK
ncbi:MAG: D-tyrosyl-tRNA(Tyr) deacylase [Lachnospiraceae bacterium]|nr:D-tyrosyl-tRNA(Tyr) deacylase [Lachnospiraceae bacterium]